MKKNLTFSKLMLIALMAILPLSFYAQKKQNVPVEKYLYIFGQGGLSVNHTDVADYGFVPSFNDPYLFKNFNGALGIGYQLGKVVGINGKFGLGTLGGEKHSQVLTPNGNATDNYTDIQLDKTNYMEGSLNLAFNISNLFFGYNPRRVFNFIPHIGIGGLRYKAGKINQLVENADATELLKEKDAEMTFTVPVGAELNFNVARKLDFFIDYTFNWVGNDKIDQVEKVFYDNNGNRTIEGIQVINDMYGQLNLGLRLKFNKKACDIETMAANADQIGMRVSPEPVEEKDGKVCFDVIFTVPAEYFEKDAVMNITPTFTYNGGQVELEPVTFVGQNVKDSQADFTVNYKNGGEFTKPYCTDFVPEMESGKLMAKPMFYVYNGTIYNSQDEIANNTYFTQGGDRVLTEGVVVPIVKCEVSNINTIVKDNTVTVRWNGDAETYDIYFGDGTPGKPTVEGVKVNTYTFNEVEPGKYNVYVKANCKRDNFGEWQQGPGAEIIPPRKPFAILYYDYNSSNLKMNTKLNREADKAIVERIKSGEPMTGFEIEGWASPEGELELNNNLAQDRANSGKHPVTTHLKKAKLKEKDYTFEMKGFGPDWNKFIELVQNSNIKDKDQIVRVIQNSKNREQEIKNMINVYPELEKDILPLIRRAEIFVK
ncbi:MAG: hypothetical protein J6W30_09860 [Bacteroidales bacterium]|nr:hypothetical protein [Bacteroidales bacterium]